MLLCEGKLLAPVYSRAQVVLLGLIITISSEVVVVVPLRERGLASLPVENGATRLFLLAEFWGVHEAALRDRGEEGSLHLFIGEFTCPR